MLCLVTQSCLTLHDPMDCSPRGSSVHRDSPGKNTGVGCHALLQGIFPPQGLNPGLPHYRILYQLSHKGSPRILEWVTYPFSSRFSRPRNQSGVSCIASRFFTNWAIREDLKSKYKSITAEETHLNLSKVAFQEYFGETNQIQSCLSPFLTKSIYPTKFNPILENPAHV